MSRDLERLWADDPPRRQEDSAGRASITTRIWDDESDADLGAETRPSPEVGLKDGLEEMWERRTPPRPPSSANGRRSGWTATPRLAQRRRQRARRRRIGLWVGSALGLIVVADGAWAGLTLKGGLEAAESDLRAGVAALQSGDIEAARAHFSSARDGAHAVDEGLSHPSATLASITPGLKGDVDVVRALGDATGLAAESGLTAVLLAEELGVTSDGFAASLYSDGRVNLDSLGDAEPFLADLVDQLGDAQALLDAAPEANFNILTEALQTAGGEIGRAEATARKSSEMFAALPTLLGAEDKQRYFLAFQTLSEARGTGGLIGLWGILSAEDGEIALKKVAPIGELTAISSPPATGPQWYEKRYGPFAALEQWQQTNFSPNLPVVSEVLLERFEAAKDKELDGVVTMDPIALGLLARGTGPLSAPELDVDVTEDSAHEVLLRSIYEEFESENEQNAYLSALITSFWASIETGDVNAAELLSGMGEAIATRHLAFYSSDEDAQGALVDAEAAGTYDSYGPNVQMVFNNNLAASKVDYFLRRKIDTNIKIEDDGSALVTTTIKVRNTAPTGGSPLLDIRISSDPPGLNRLYLSAMLPLEAEVQELSLDGEFRPEIPDNEDGYPTVWDIVVLEAGQSASMKVTYVLEDAFSDASFDLTMIPQATSPPDSFSLDVQPPSGFSASISETGSSGRDASVEGVLDRTRTFKVHVEEP